MFRARGTRKDLAARLRCQSAPLSTRLSPERHRQHTPRATRTRTRGGGAAFGVMNSPPRTQRTSSTARRSPGSGPRGRYKWMMAACLWGEILADVCMTSFTFHCCAGLATTVLPLSHFCSYLGLGARERSLTSSRACFVQSELTQGRSGPGVNDRFPGREGLHMFASGLGT